MLGQEERPGRSSPIEGRLAGRSSAPFWGAVSPAAGPWTRR